jgi:hypothetical protein
VDAEMGVDAVQVGRSNGGCALPWRSSHLEFHGKQPVTWWGAPKVADEGHTAGRIYGMPAGEGDGQRGSEARKAWRGTCRW